MSSYSHNSEPWNTDCHLDPCSNSSQPLCSKSSSNEREPHDALARELRHKGTKFSSSSDIKREFYTVLNINNTNERDANAQVNNIVVLITLVIILFKILISSLNIIALASLVLWA